jgi:hypothetical protein
MLVGFRALVEWVGEAQPGRLHHLGLLLPSFLRVLSASVRDLICGWGDGLTENTENTEGRSGGAHAKTLRRKGGKMKWWGRLVEWEEEGKAQPGRLHHLGLIPSFFRVLGASVRELIRGWGGGWRAFEICWLA